MNAMYKDIQKLSEKGIIGFFEGLEVVTVFGYDRENNFAFNVLTVVVAIEHKVELDQKLEILSEERIEIESNSNIFFGIQRQYMSFDEFYESINVLEETEIWNASGKDLIVGSVAQVKRKFVPSDSMLSVPLNNILKNNYFSGSYIYEWFNVDKVHLKFLFNKPALLQELSSKVAHYLPLGIASLSDKLGNIILQLPISIIHSEITQQKNSSNLDLEIYWHKEAIEYKRNLQFFLMKENDDIYPDFSLFQVKEGKYSISMQHYGFNYRYIIWDKSNDIVLVASNISGFISSVNMNGGISSNEPRVFNPTDAKTNQQRVNVITSWQDNITSEKNNTIFINNIQNARVFARERDDLLRRKEFIQYHKGDEKRALADLRLLINKYGQKSVWLWDPYLSANDILNTLFYCEYSNSQLRAITILNYQEPKIKKRLHSLLSKKFFFNFFKNKIQSKKNLLNTFNSDLEEKSGNRYGLDLEFRARYGNHGWSFHDRFIIFPFTDQGAMAWSLGTSVNSLGQSHHIFQKVSHGQLIADAFDELWQELGVEECLVWKS